HRDGGFHLPTICSHLVTLLAQFELGELSILECAIEIHVMASASHNDDGDALSNAHLPTCGVLCATTTFSWPHGYATRMRAQFERVTVCSINTYVNCDYDNLDCHMYIFTKLIFLHFDSRN
uniref:Secreted protein n=1 Tax=Mesocestoides corti TaxID=53468 RepID=A0A5K3FQA6_MESCO